MTNIFFLHRIGLYSQIKKKRVLIKMFFILFKELKVNARI